MFDCEIAIYRFRFTAIRGPVQQDLEHLDLASEPVLALRMRRLGSAILYRITWKAQLRSNQ